jgi:excisionase family DNA binding protein
MPRKISGIELYDLQELSKKLGIHLVTLQRYCRKGKLRGQKIGRGWQVSDENLKAFINAEK